MRKLLTLIPLLLLLTATRSLAIDCDSLSTSAADSISGTTVYVFGYSTTSPYFATYQWDFGDGSGPAFGTGISHTYTTPGTYAITLLTRWVDGADTCWRTAIDSVTIGGSLDCSTLSTSFVASLVPGGIGVIASATGAPSYFEWDFGDGSGTSYGSTTTHVYTASGTYLTTLTTVWISGTDTCIHTDTASYTVTVPTGLDCSTLSASLSDTLSGSTVALSVSTTPGYTEFYYWDYGDGTSGAASADPSHTYSGTGTYTVTVTVVTSDGAGDSCVNTLTTVVDITGGGTDCSSWYADFTDGGSAGAEYFLATSSAAPTGFTTFDSWDFGDGTYASGPTTTHTYTSDGTYSVTLTTIWVSSTGDTCTHSATHTVDISGTGGSGSSTLSGTLYGPSIGDSASFFVWLITYDSTSGGYLTAIDSTYSTVSPSGTYRYEFHSVPTGDYRTKAKLLSSIPGTTGWVPTYDSTSTYWGGAWVIHHLGTVSDGNVDIHLTYGTVPSGSGFIGGSITAGAGKATDAGVANMLVYLRDAATNIITYTYTDATGAYSFSSLAPGTYNVYPEALNYATTPSSTVVITTGTPIEGSVNFRESTTLHTITPVTTAVNNVAAANNAVKIFPNPATGTLHILWTAVDNNKHISVTDITGRELISTNADNATAQKDLDISSLAKGVYIVHITSANVDTTQKLVVE